MLAGQFNEIEGCAFCLVAAVESAVCTPPEDCGLRAPLPPISEFLLQLLARPVEHNPEIVFGDVKPGTYLPVRPLFDLIKLEYLRDPRRQLA